MDWVTNKRPAGTQHGDWRAVGATRAAEYVSLRFLKAAAMMSLRRADSKALRGEQGMHWQSTLDGETRMRGLTRNSGGIAGYRGQRRGGIETDALQWASRGLFAVASLMSRGWQPRAGESAFHR